VLKTHTPQIIEYTLPIKDDIRYYESRLLYFSETEVAAFIRDISERKNVELKLKESEDMT